MVFGVYDLRVEIAAVFEAVSLELSLSDVVGERFPFIADEDGCTSHLLMHGQHL
jgi:hypothetical protein